MRGVEPDPLTVGGDGEAEAFPARPAERGPCSMGVLDDPPQRGGTGFPHPVSAVLGLVANLAPGAVGSAENSVAGWLIGAIPAQAEQCAAGAGGCS